jgi:hypothetical protein
VGLRAAGVGAAATALVGVAALAVGSGPAEAAPTTLFPMTSPPGAYSVTVPAGICFVTISGDGGQGATASSGGAGGVGAHVSARVAVSPGTTLSVMVGDGGDPGTASTGGTGAGRRGGGGGGGGAGGGGGSSFVIGTATNLSPGASTRTGAGQVTITDDPSTDSCPTALVVTPEFTG